MRSFTVARLDSVGYTHDLEHWLADAASGYEPNPVGAIAEYGYSRLITKGWKDVPIQIPESEREEWPFLRKTFDDLRAFQLSAAGEFLAIAGKDPKRIGELLVQQVDERVAKMQEAANRPLTFYQPMSWDPHDEWDIEAIQEGDYAHEFHKFDLPFALREELECFAYGMEHLR